MGFVSCYEDAERVETAQELSFMAEDLRNAARCIAAAANGKRSQADTAHFQMAQRQIERALEGLARIADESPPLIRESLITEVHAGRTKTQENIFGTEACGNPTTNQERCIPSQLTEFSVEPGASRTSARQLQKEALFSPLGSEQVRIAMLQPSWIKEKGQLSSENLGQRGNFSASHPDF